MIYFGKFMGKLFIAAFAALLMTLPSFGWGREGHEVIAKIAENHLQPSAKKKIERYLGGHSIVYYAKWMDDYRHTPEYKFTTKWHTAPVDADLKYDDSLLDPVKGNAIYGLEKAIDALENYRELTDSAVAVNIKYIVHIVGDLHCPSHVKYTTYDWDFSVYMPKSKGMVTWHTVWDSAVIRATRIFSSTEWAEEIDLLDRKQAREIIAGTPRDWLHDSAERCKVQFEWGKEGQKMNQDFLNLALPLVETQILHAGYRLASVLNGLF